MFRGLTTQRLGHAIIHRPSHLPLTSHPFHNQAANNFEDRPWGQLRKKKTPQTNELHNRPLQPIRIVPPQVAIVSPEKSKSSATQRRQPDPDSARNLPKRKVAPKVSISQLLAVARTRSDPSLLHIHRPRPGSIGNLINAWKSDPTSFDGETAYLIDAGWSQRLPGFWSESFSLLIPNPIAKPSLHLEPELGPCANACANAMTSYIKVATTPTADSGSSLMLHFDHRRYLFGHLTEGTQRAWNQRKYAMAKLEYIFLSGQTKWENTGGMTGMLLTLADVMELIRRDRQELNNAKAKSGRKYKSLLPKIPERIEIHGARNLAYSIATSRSFVFRKGLPIRPVEVFEDPRLANPDLTTPDWEDEYIQVWKMPVIADEPSDGCGTSRKRSHEVMSAEDENLTTRLPPPDISNEQQRINQEATVAVVDKMFNATWSMDFLQSIKLHDVDLPATIFVRKDGHVQKYQGPLPGNERGEVPNIDVLVRYPYPAGKIQRLPSTGSKSTMSVCYVVKNRGRRGKFNAALASQYGIEPKQFKLIAAGQTVEGTDGVQVTPDMVLGAPVKPAGFAVLDIPSTTAIETFLARPEWKHATLMENVHVFYWILGSSVVDDLRIQNFMQERPDLRHVVLASDVCPNMLALDSYAVLQAKLRRIDADRFSLLQFDNTTRDLSFIGPNVEAARSGMTVMLSPEFKIKNDDIIPFPTFVEVGEIQDEVLTMAAEAKAAIEQPKFIEEIGNLQKGMPNLDTEIIPLGTGSATPSKYRNVSSTLIRVPQYGNYVLDCGENTMGQLRRIFPSEELTEVLQNLRCIFISHMHADHHLGTASLLRAWADATAGLNPQPQLGVICPIQMKYFLIEHNRIEDLNMERVVLHPHRSTEEVPNLLEITKLSHIESVPVNHCRDSFAGVLTWPSGLKIAYSGDCRPSDALVKAGKGATLLIHESTFDDDKLDDAKAKFHSTISEALDVGCRMGTRRILLTHFSQRYAKVPIVNKQQTESTGDLSVLMAFDQMRIKLGEFPHAEKFLPAIRRFFELNGE